MSDEYTPSQHRMRDAVANGDWMDVGYVTPETIAVGYFEFDRMIAAVKADAWDEGAVVGYSHGRDDQQYSLAFAVPMNNPYRTPSATHAESWPRTSPSFDTTAEAYEWLSTTHEEGE